MSNRPANSPTTRLQRKGLRDRDLSRLQLAAWLSIRGMELGLPPCSDDHHQSILVAIPPTQIINDNEVMMKYRCGSVLEGVTSR
ncbi:hypothetical protein ACMFWY_15045 [Roseiconus sp. JC912]|uniref:hypothetical protein n=1 Tax=Roseiconus sp. JC912 TaxID=3396307 RepID=UPI003A4C72DD